MFLVSFGYPFQVLCKDLPELQVQYISGIFPHLNTEETIGLTFRVKSSLTL